MPTKAVQKFTAWSYSRLTEWEQCPFKAKCKHLDKIKEPEPGPDSPLTHGKEAHEDADKYARGVGRALPGNLRLFKEEFAALRARKRDLRTEFQLALTKAWAPTGCYGSDVWLRIVFDVTWDEHVKAEGKTYLTRHVVDYKTGKIREEQQDQLELYALGALSMEPAPEVAIVELWYLDQGETRPEGGGKVYGVGEVPSLRRKWVKRVAPMLADTAFIPQPGNHCRWCHLAKSKGGICVF